MADPILIIDSDADGIIATHPPRAVLPVIASPIPDEQKAKNFNTFRAPLIAIGCLRLPNKGFAFDHSIVSPDSARAFTRFARLMQALKDNDDADPKRFPPCSVFGHADPVGKDEYNKSLSGRRALAVYGVLTRDVDLWDELFNSTINGGDRWGTRAIQTMLSAPLKHPPKDPLEQVFYTGPIDDGKTKETRDLTDQAVSDWRVARGFGPGTLTPALRKFLFHDYMDAICQFPSGDAFSLDPTDFIAKGKGKKGLKGDVQGCGEFNPIFLLSKAKEDLAAKDPVLADVRNQLYEIDRRVIVFIFKHGTEIDQTKWPCPAAREDSTGCRKRFWSDHLKRSGETDDDRTFGEDMAFLTVDDANNVVTTPIEQTGNTMACRFYHAFAQNSPCEVKLKEWIVRLKVASFNGQLQLLSFRRYVIKAGESESSAIIRGTTDEFGVIRIPVFDETTKMTLHVDAGRDITDKDDNPPDDKADPPDESKFLALVLDAGKLEPRDIDNELAVKQRLYNLGFGENDPATMSDDEFAKAFAQFRRKTAAVPDNRTDDDVRRDIMKAHDLVGIPNPPPDPDADASAQGDGSSSSPSGS